MAERTGLRVGVAVWGIVLFAGCRAFDVLLEAQSLAAAVAQVVLVEWGASRLGVVWTDPASPPRTSALAKRVAQGAAVGFAVAALVIGTLVASRALTLEPVARAEIAVLAIGLFTAALHAWRDELLVHGIPLRALSGTATASPLSRTLACGVTSAGMALGRPDADPRTVFAAALVGVVFGVLWLQDRGALVPVSAHAAFRWASGALVSGGIVHGRLAADAWAGGNAGILGGTAAVVALAPAGILAVVWAAARMSPPPARVGYSPVDE